MALVAFVLRWRWPREARRRFRRSCQPHLDGCERLLAEHHFALVKVSAEKLCVSACEEAQAGWRLAWWQTSLCPSRNAARAARVRRRRPGGRRSARAPPPVWWEEARRQGCEMWQAKRCSEPSALDTSERARASLSGAKSSCTSESSCAKASTPSTADMRDPLGAARVEAQRALCLLAGRSCTGTQTQEVQGACKGWKSNFEHDSNCVGPWASGMARCCLVRLLSSSYTRLVMHVVRTHAPLTWSIVSGH